MAYSGEIRSCISLFWQLCRDKNSPIETPVTSASLPTRQLQPPTTDINLVSSKPAVQLGRGAVFDLPVRFNRPSNLAGGSGLSCRKVSSIQGPLHVFFREVEETTWQSRRLVAS